MFAPQPIARGKVVYLCKILHIINGGLILRNSQLVFELATSGDLHTMLLLFDLLLFKIVKRVRATRAGPHVWESDLLSCPLSEKELAALGMEHEGGERSMEKTFINILHQMAWYVSHSCKDTQQLASTILKRCSMQQPTGFLVKCTKRFVVLIDNNAPFVHDLCLLKVIAREIDRGQFPGVSRGASNRCLGTR